MLALRGTTSIEDVITDSVAVPERLADDFVPKALREAQSGASAGPLYAHAGIRAAADAVLRVRARAPDSASGSRQNPHAACHAAACGLPCSLCTCGSSWHFFQLLLQG